MNLVEHPARGAERRIGRRRGIQKPKQLVEYGAVRAPYFAAVIALFNLRCRPRGVIPNLGRKQLKMVAHRLGQHQVVSVRGLVYAIAREPPSPSEKVVFKRDFPL
jgi:hypothetical protein